MKLSPTLQIPQLFRLPLFLICSILLACGLRAQQNRPPGILPIPDQTTDEDVPILNIPFVIGDAETPAADLKVTVTSLNTLLIPAGNLTVGGSGGNRTLSLRPAANLSGVSGVIVRVLDANNLSAQTSFTVRVLAVNDPPVISGLADQSITEGSPPLLLPFFVIDADSTPGFTVTAQMLRTNLIRPTLTVSTLNATNAGTHRLMIATQPGQSGSGIVQVSASDKKTTNYARFVLTIQPAPFSAPTSDFTPVLGRASSLVDVDGDEDLDLVFLPANTPVASAPLIYRNLGAGRWGTALSPGGLATGVTWADFDGDGDLDLLEFGAPGSGVRLMLNDSTRESLRFTAVSGVKVGSGTTVLGAGWGDFDGDGDPDLVVSGTGPGGPATRIFLNHGGDFVTDSTVLPLIPGPIVVGDVDNDGLPDILANSVEGNWQRTVVLRNNGAMGFETINGPWPDGRFTSAGLADFDGDGWPDVWLYTRGSERNNRLTTYLSVGPNLWMKGAEVVESVESSSVPLVGDFDQDGAVDVIARTAGFFQIGATTQLRFYPTLFRNDGGGALESDGYMLSDALVPLVSMGDVDGDGDLDLIAEKGKSRIQLNSQRPPNSLPGAPVGLVARSQGAHVEFSWRPAHDLNQRRPLMYNVRVGTRPGANDLLPSMSSATGVRLQPAPGNAGYRTELELNLEDAPSDTLYWSVQAVDASYAGGPWSVEAKAVIELPENHPPVIIGPTEVTMFEDVVTGLSFMNVPLTITDDHTPTGRLALSVSSTTEVPPVAFTLNRSSSDRPPTNLTAFVLHLTGLPERTGETTLVLKAVDASGLATTNLIRVTVLPVNRRPVLEIPEIPLQLVGSPIPPIEIRVHDRESSASQLELSVPSTTGGIEPGDIEIVPHENVRAISFRRLPDHSGTIWVNFLLTDPGGASTTGYLSIKRTKQLVLAAGRQADGQLLLTVRPESGYLYRLERSPDLQSWMPDSLIQSPAGEVVELSLNPPPEWPQTFYRIKGLD